MQPILNFSEEPFNFLTEAELALLNNKLEIHFFVKNEVIIKKGAVSPGVFTLNKGAVVQTRVAPDKNTAIQEDQIVSYFSDDDIFGHKSLHEPSEYFYLCLEESICFLLDENTFSLLSRSNPKFHDYLYSGIDADKSSSLQDVEMNIHAMAKISSYSLKSPIIVEANTPLIEVAKKITQAKVNSVLVKVDEQYGILTKTDMLKAYATGNDANLTAGMIATLNPICISQEDVLMNALILMEKHNIERLPVKDNEQYTAVLELKEMMYAFSNMSSSIGLQIEHAENTEDLKKISNNFKPLIQSLQNKGVNVTHIMDLVSTINRKMLKKLAECVIPKEIHADVCFFIMGSEGREEQMLKTDQDNGMVFGNRISHNEIQPYAQNITDMLLQLGYPACKGNIMVSNPEWCMNSENWNHKILQWIKSADTLSVMEMAIFMDASPVFGENKLLEDILTFLKQNASKNSIFFQYFVKAALQFESALSFFGGLKQHGKGIDIKRSGIFPIVHGVRTLAFQHGVAPKNTIQRIHILKENRVITQQLGQELPEAIKILLQMRLKQRLQRTKPNQTDDTPDLINISQLNRMERDLLRDALKIADDFKLFLKDYYQILM